MKPRLAVLQLTQEDFNIYGHAMARWPWGGRILGFWMEADRRDADLMLTAQQLPWAWLCQVGTGDWQLVRSKDAAKARDPLWGAQWTQS